MALEVLQAGPGSGSGTFVQVDGSHQASRSSIRPLDTTVNGVQGGQFNLQATTGAISAIAANGQIFSLRWGDAQKIMLLQRLSVSAVCTAFSTGTGADLEAVKASSFTAVGSGGSTIVPSTTSQMARPTTMAASSFNQYGELRVSTTVALTAGTQTLDTAGFGAAQLGGVAGAGTPLVDLFNVVSFGQHPIVVTNNTGLVVRAVTAVPSSNTWRYSVNICWVEVASY